MNVLAEFFNGFVINGFYFLRQQCSNDAIVHSAQTYRVSHIEMVIYRRRKKAQNNLFSVITGSYFQENLRNF